MSETQSRLKVFGAPWCPDCRRSKQFLEAHKIPYEWIDIDRDETGMRYVEEVQGGKRIIPMIEFGDGTYLFEPSDSELADKLGVKVEAERPVYDLIVVGGGPAGLTAAMYASREGIDTVVVDKGGLGGQAGATARIDNYPGFPEGIGGGELAQRLVEQARRYDVELLPGTAVQKLERSGGDLVVSLNNGQNLCGHTVILAPGSAYKKLGVPGEERFTGAGVHYCATCDGPFYRGTGAQRSWSSSEAETPVSKRPSSFCDSPSTSRSSRDRSSPGHPDCSKTRQQQIHG